VWRGGVPGPPHSTRTAKERHKLLEYAGSLLHSVADLAYYTARYS